MAKPQLGDIIWDIKGSIVYRRFLRIVKDCGIEEICDFHTHAATEPSSMDGALSSSEIGNHGRLASPFQYATAFYESLLADEGISASAVVFDVPLGTHDLAKRNRLLLACLGSANVGGASRMVPFAVITPEMQAPEITAYVEEGARGFKMTPHPSSPYMTRGAISGLSLSEMLNSEALRIADAFALPLVVHLPQPVVAPKTSRALKEELNRLAWRYPNLRIVLAHLGLCQSVPKIEDMLDYIEKNGLTECIYLDVSAVTIPAVLEVAFGSRARLLFGTDIDFSLTERGRYVALKYSRGGWALAEGSDRGKVITALVSTSFGHKLRDYVAGAGVRLDAPLLSFQMEGIVEAMCGIRQKGKSQKEVKAIAEDLFFRNAQTILRSTA